MKKKCPEERSSECNQKTRGMRCEERLSKEFLIRAETIVGIGRKFEYLIERPREHFWTIRWAEPSAGSGYRGEAEIVKLHIESVIKNLG